MPGDIDTNFIHDCDRLRANEAGDRAGTQYFKSLTGQITHQAFGHLAAGRVAGAKKQHARFLNHGDPPGEESASNHIVNKVAAAAPINCATIKSGTSIGLIPANVSLSE